MSFVLTLLYITLSYVFPGEVFPAVGPYRITLAIGIAALVISFARSVMTGRYRVGSPQIHFLAALTFVMALSVVFADRWLGGAAYVLQDFGVSITMFLLIIWNVDSVRKVRTVVALIAVLSVALSVQGIAAYHYGYRADQLVMTDTDNGDGAAADDRPVNSVLRVRGFGIMNDPNDLALGLLAVLPLLALTWQKGRRVRNCLLVLLPAAAIAYGIFLTHSRGASFGVAAMIFAGVMPRLGRVRAIAVTALFVFALMAVNVSGGRAMTSEDDSAVGRVNSWSEGLQMLKEQPVLGVGYRNYTEHNTRTAHNSFVLCFAELGLAGYFFWVGLLVTTFIQLSALRRMDDRLNPEITKWTIGLRLSLIGFLSAAFFLSRTYIPLLYLLLALSVAVVALANKQGSPAALPRPGRLLTLISGWELGSILFMYAFVRVNMFVLK